MGNTSSGAVEAVDEKGVSELIISDLLTDICVNGNERAQSRGTACDSGVLIVKERLNALPYIDLKQLSKNFVQTAMISQSQSQGNRDGHISRSAVIKSLAPDNVVERERLCAALIAVYKRLRSLVRLIFDNIEVPEVSRRGDYCDLFSRQGQHSFCKQRLKAIVDSTTPRLTSRKELKQLLANNKMITVDASEACRLNGDEWAGEYGVARKLGFSKEEASKAAVRGRVGITHKNPAKVVDGKQIDDKRCASIYGPVSVPAQDKNLRLYLSHITKIVNSQRLREQKFFGFLKQLFDLSATPISLVADLNSDKLDRLSAEVKEAVIKSIRECESDLVTALNIYRDIRGSITTPDAPVLDRPDWEPNPRRNNEDDRNYDSRPYRDYDYRDYDYGDNSYDDFGSRRDLFYESRYGGGKIKPQHSYMVKSQNNQRGGSAASEAMEKIQNLLNQAVETMKRLGSRASGDVKAGAADAVRAGKEIASKTDSAVQEYTGGGPGRRHRRKRRTRAKRHRRRMRKTRRSY